MKQRICITIDENVLKKAKDKIRDKTFRNKSHILEFALDRLLKEVKNG